MMRLICPNCEAQYEVPVEVIPDAGRDVQCSNCGTTWFQAHPYAAASGAPERARDRFAEAAGEAPKAAGAPPRSEPAPDVDTTPRATRTDPAIPAERTSDTATPPAGSAPQPDHAGDASSGAALRQRDPMDEDAGVAPAQTDEPAAQDIGAREPAPAPEPDDFGGTALPRETPQDTYPGIPSDAQDAPAPARTDPHPGAEAPAATDAPAADRDAPPQDTPHDMGAGLPPVPQDTPAQSRREPDEAEPADDDAPAPAAPPEPARARRLDPGVAEVLRTEAEREARRRAADGAASERQPEADPETAPAAESRTATKTETEAEADPRAVQARDRMARLLGEPKDEARRAQLAATERARAAASSTGDVGGRGRYDRDEDMLGDPGPTPAEIASRRVLLPDVNEINQSLRPGDKRRGEERGTDSDENRGGGFGRAFLLVLALGIVLIALYLAAPAIAQALPALADPLAAYVEAVNAARGWLGARVTALLAWVNGLG